MILYNYYSEAYCTISPNPISELTVLVYSWGASALWLQGRLGEWTLGRAPISTQTPEFGHAGLGVADVRLGTKEPIQE